MCAEVFQVYGAPERQQSQSIARSTHTARCRVSTSIKLIDQEPNSKKTRCRPPSEQFFNNGHVDCQLVGECDAQPNQNDAFVDPSRKNAERHECRDPRVKTTSTDIRRPVRRLSIRLLFAKHRCGDRRVCEPLDEGRTVVAIPRQDRQECQRHADDDGWINAAEARDRKAGRRSGPFCEVGNDKSTDDEEDRDAQKSVLGETGCRRDGNLGDAVCGWTPMPCGEMTTAATATNLNRSRICTRAAPDRSLAASVHRSICDAGS